MLYMILFNTLISSLSIGILGRHIGTRGLGVVAGIPITVALGCCLYCFQKYALTNTIVYLPGFTWFSSGFFTITIEFVFDSLTLTMLTVVYSISTIVHFYSLDYLRNDPHLPRFIAYLSLFTFCMVILVTAENFVQLFLGWEGVGLCSYLLINFWHTRMQANKAALKAIFINKIGDLALLAAFGFLFFSAKSLSFSTLTVLFPYFYQLTTTLFSFSTGDLIGFFLILGAVGKSAQIGLHVWLPDAMEGPTPVSALLHAATMVTAGIFLLIRTSFIFALLPTALLGIMFIGALTALFAATTGLLQNDLKKIIAFSTCSQLGYMFVSCGFAQYSLALFHLFNHAFFKALLFLAAGSVIHAMQDEQDIRKMGGLGTFLPLTFTFFLLASLALMGFPSFSGYYSKDMIIETSFSAENFGNIFITFCLVIAAGFTAAYSFRLIYYVFLARVNFSRWLLPGISEPVNYVQILLLILALLSIVSGYLTSEIFIGFGGTLFTEIFVAPVNQGPLGLFENEYLSPLVKQAPLVVSLCSIVFTFVLLTKLSGRGSVRSYLHPAIYFSYFFSNQKWYFDKIINTGANFAIRALYHNVIGGFEKGLIEYFGPLGFYRIFRSMTTNVQWVHQGNYSYYLLIIEFLAFWLLLFMSFFFLLG